MSALLGLAIALVVAFVAPVWAPRLSITLVRRALRCLPESIDPQTRARWVEEVEADLDEYRARPVGGLFFALRVAREGGEGLASVLAMESKPTAQGDYEHSGEEGSDGEITYIFPVNGNYYFDDAEVECSTLLRRLAVRSGRHEWVLDLGGLSVEEARLVAHEIDELGLETGGS